MTEKQLRKLVPPGLGRLQQQKGEGQDEADGYDGTRQHQHRSRGALGAELRAGGRAPELDGDRARGHSSCASWSRAMADDPSPSWAMVRATGSRSANGFKGCAVITPDPSGYS